MEKETINQKYLDLHTALEAEFFEIIDRGKPSQHRVLRAGKSIDVFNQKHSAIWQNHEAELIANDFMEAPMPPEPVRDLVAEIDDLKARIKKLEKEEIYNGLE